MATAGKNGCAKNSRSNLNVFAINSITKHLLGQAQDQIHDIDLDGCTALHAGAAAGHLEVTQCLLHHGGSVNNQ
jgi:ankyrin repeat protein